MVDGNAKLLDGKWLAAVVRARVAKRVASLGSSASGAVPGLATIIVGDNPASQTYVASKQRSAKEIGFQSFDAKLPANATFAEVSETIQRFNADSRVSGILLQLPTPKHLDSNKLLDLISPAKDADGLHPYNQGLLMRGQGAVRPCTPLGAMKLIDLAFAKNPEQEIPRVDLAGKKAVVIGRSILVGKPMGLLLLERNATVQMTHSKSPNLAELCQEADIVVAAVGVPRLVKGDWVKPGAIVIDVGINRDAEGKLCGDVDAATVSPIAGALSPVPGGAGLMTVAMLMLNTLNAFLADKGLPLEEV